MVAIVGQQSGVVSYTSVSGVLGTDDKEEIVGSLSDRSIDQQCANAIRALAIDAIHQAKSGHPGMVLGIADAAYVLWSRFLSHHPRHPHWPNRDRFVLSAGHASMLLLHCCISPDTIFLSTI